MDRSRLKFKPAATLQVRQEPGPVMVGLLPGGGLTSKRLMSPCIHQRQASGKSRSLFTSHRPGSLSMKLKVIRSPAGGCSSCSFSLRFLSPVDCFTAGDGATGACPKPHRNTRSAHFFIDLIPSSHSSPSDVPRSRSFRPVCILCSPPRRQALKPSVQRDGDRWMGCMGISTMASDHLLRADPKPRLR